MVGKEELINSPKIPVKMSDVERHAETAVKLTQSLCNIQDVVAILSDNPRGESGGTGTVSFHSARLVQRIGPTSLPWWKSPPISDLM